MCWYHCHAAYHKQLNKIKTPTTKGELDADIHVLQASISPELFASATVLFLEKWTARSEDDEET
jgi:hypothetical protein